MKRTVYTRWWFWLLIAIIALGIINLVETGSQSNQSGSPAASPSMAEGSQQPSPQATGSSSATTEPGASTASPAAPDTSPPLASPGTGAPTVQPSAPDQAAPADQVPLPEQKILAYTHQLKGAAFIKDITVGTDNLEIRYFGSFAEYKQAHPDTSVTASDYMDAFSSGDAVNQILMEEPTRLFRQFPGTASIDITLPYNGNTYSVSLTKGSIEKFYSADLDSIKTDEQWKKQISDPFFTKDYRDQFAKRFIQVN